MSLSLKKGEILGLIGKSGSGKSTLLRCIYGLEDLASGEITLGDDYVLGPAYNLIPGHENMKLVSQEFYVLENHTVEENILDKLIGFTLEHKERRVKDLLSLLDLKNLRSVRAKHLSSGQKQRVSIARAFAILPKVLLLDEPFSNLDKLLSEKLLAYIVKEVQKQRTSVILITHQPEEALKYADSLVIMNEGKIVESGNKWDVYYHPKTSRLSGLLGDYNLVDRKDLEKNSIVTIKTKRFVRPDRLVLSGSTSPVDFRLEITSCVYNGKCYEVQGETKNGNTLIAYSYKPLIEGRAYSFVIKS